MRPIAAAFALTALLGAAVQAQPYPTRSIRLIVPYPAGGALDVMGRLVAQSLTESLGQQVIVDNRPGGGSTLAGRDVAHAEPDGYTLLLGSAASLAIGPAIVKDAGYDPVTSFTPVAFVSTVPYVMLAGPRTSDRTVKEVIADARAHPGKLTIGAPTGAPPQLIVAWFKTSTATDILVVPYKGAPAVFADLIGGRIDLGFESLSIALAHVRDGNVRALGVATRQRLPDLPGVPTMIESGLADFVADSWCGVLAPAGTPAEIIDKLNAAINASLTSAAVQARLKALAAETRPGAPQDFAALIAEERPKWIALAKLANLGPQ